MIVLGRLFSSVVVWYGDGVENLKFVCRSISTCDVRLVWVLLPNLFSVLLGMGQLFKIIHELVEIGLTNTHLFCFVWHQPKPKLKLQWKLYLVYFIQ